MVKKTKELVLNDQIEPYFQPIQEISTGEINKYEVLARGVVDEEVIEPKHFINSASRLGILIAITKTIIKKSFKYFQNREEMFSINLTERDLLEGYLSEFLKDKLSVYSIDPSRVTFEILENVVVDKNFTVISEQIKELKDNEKLALIVETIVNLAKSLGVKTVAEFVKDEYTYETVKELGIDYAQGYFIGKPQPTI